MARVKQGIETLFVLPLNLMQPLPSLVKAIEEKEEIFFDLNRQQLDRGLDSTGKDLGRYKSLAYKGRLRPVDLLKEGDFRNKFTLEVNSTETIIFSLDEKTQTLETRWGQDIFGVPRAYYPTIGDEIKESFFKDVRRKIFK